MNLKEAVTRAGNEADEARFEICQSWAKTFVASLEANGFVIVPKEATKEMLRSLSMDPSYPYVVSERGMSRRSAIYRAQIATRPQMDDAE